MFQTNNIVILAETEIDGDEKWIYRTRKAKVLNKSGGQWVVEKIEKHPHDRLQNKVTIPAPQKINPGNWEKANVSDLNIEPGFEVYGIDEMQWPW